MNKVTVCLLVAALCAGIVGCSAIHSAEESFADLEQGIEETRIYKLSAAESEVVIRKSFQQGWADKELIPIDNQNIGYQIKLYFAIDREYISAQAIESTGGYFFRIINRGTAPVVGVPARGKLRELIESNALLVQQH